MQLWVVMVLLILLGLPLCLDAKDKNLNFVVMVLLILLGLPHRTTNSNKRQND